MDEPTHHASSIQLGAVFRTITELTQAMVAVGQRLGINKEVLCSPYVCMLVCSVGGEKHCDAHLLGMYSQRDGFFHVRRCSLTHGCSSCSTRQALEQEVSKPRYMHMRLGQVTEELLGRGYKVGYRDVYELLHSVLERNSKENVENSRAKTGGSLAACLKCYEAEFKMLNPGIVTRIGEGEFFYKHTDYSSILRPVSELKMLQRPDGFLVLGLLYDSNNEPVVQSLLLTEAPKARSLKIFLAYNSANFYIIELDSEIIEIMHALGMDFFVKTRDVCMYLEEPETEDAIAYQRFLNCNYGDREYLNLEPRYYLRRYCKASLYGLNNMPPVSFDFASPEVLALSFFDCLSSLLCSLAIYMEARCQVVYETPEFLLSDRMTEYLEDAARRIAEDRSATLRDDWIQSCDLEACYCPCGKFQEFLIPCIHAVQKLSSIGVEPYLYASSIYSREGLLKLRSPVPVVGLPAGCSVSCGRGNLRTELSTSSNENNSELAIEI